MHMIYVRVHTALAVLINGIIPQVSDRLSGLPAIGWNMIIRLRTGTQENT